MSRSPARAINKEEGFGLLELMIGTTSAAGAITTPAFSKRNNRPGRAPRGAPWRLPTSYSR
eukprot:10250310-Alexandrium_andersonii.AAC.1